MSQDDVSSTFFDDAEKKRRWEVQCDIREQVWKEFYDVFGWMYVKDSEYHEAITDEVNRRVELHFEKERQILDVMGEKASKPPEHVPNDADLVHLVDIQEEVNEPQKQWKVWEEEESENETKKDDEFEEERRKWQEKLDDDVKKWIKESRNGEEYEW